MIEAPTSISPGAVHTHMFLCVFVYLHAVVDPNCKDNCKDNHLNILFLKLGRSAV